MMKRTTAVVSMIVCGLMVLGCVSVYIPSIIPYKSELKEEVVEKAKTPGTKTKVLLIDVSGAITDTGTDGVFGKSNIVAGIKEILDKAEEDRMIRAVVFRVNSPGGTVTACDTLYRIIHHFRESTSVPVLVSMMDIAASGGYYISLAADKIYASPTTITGSIGVVAVFPNLEQITNRLGIKMRVIKSGTKKDLGSIWRDFDPEEKEILQNLIQDFYVRFVDLIVERRTGIDKSALSFLTDGRVFSATEAERNHLIDGVMHLDEVIEEARKMGNAETAKVIMYKRTGEYKKNIYSSLPQQPPQHASVMNIDLSGLKEVLRPSFQYIWLP